MKSVKILGLMIIGGVLGFVLSNYNGKKSLAKSNVKKTKSNKTTKKVRKRKGESRKIPLRINNI